jgi:hypothetical protein
MSPGILGRFLSGTLLVAEYQDGSGWEKVELSLTYEMLYKQSLAGKVLASRMRMALLQHGHE